MITSEHIDSLAEALVAFQGEVEAIPKTADNPFFKSKYADLPSIVKAAQSLLTKNGLAVVQTIGGVFTEDRDTLTTRLLHTSGQWIEDEAWLHLGEKDTAQAQGSAVTYARRYAYSAILGLVTDVDDDGNAASDLDDDKPSEEGQKVRRTRRTKAQLAADRATAVEVPGGPTADVTPGEAPADPAVVADPETEKPPAPPDGWESTAEAVAAHNILAKRIVALPADFREPAMAFRKVNGWPLSLAQFNELEEVVNTAEGFSPSAG